MNKKLMFSTGKDDWETPQAFYDKLNEEFHFTLDPCSSEENHKCEKYYTTREDGLSKDWGGERVFCNPPYSKTGNQDAWVKKAYEESQKPGTTVVMLIPARTDTKRFHKLIWKKAKEIRFLEGRLCFEVHGKPVMDAKGKPMRAPFPSMVVVF